MFEQGVNGLRLSDACPRFLLYAEAELQFSRQSLVKYHDCVRQIIRILGDRPVCDLGQQDVLSLKANLLQRSLSVSRQVSILSTLKRLLQYCAQREGLAVLDPSRILIPRRPRREVVYLTAEEVQRFVHSIPLTTARGRPCRSGIRFRALVEALLGSAMRIGELLSLNRTDINFEDHEARIIGKGNKERIVFFTDRALLWLSRYLELRQDKHPALFVTQDGERRLRQVDIWRPFARQRAIAGILKPVRPHLLRHTAATQLLFNGCPIGHIKEILGHERLETTCRYYLGLDHRAAKDAHQKFLKYSESSATNP